MKTQNRFRAWSKSLEKMVYFELKDLYYQDDKISGLMFHWGPDQHFGEDDDLIITESIGIKEDIENGRYIFDGDIVERAANMRRPGTHDVGRDKSLWKVYWDQDSFSFKAVGANEHGWPWPQEMWRLWNNKSYGPPSYDHEWSIDPIVRIVGDIFQNPELLEDSK